MKNHKNTTGKVLDILTKNKIPFVKTETPNIFLIPFGDEKTDVRYLEKNLHRCGLQCENFYGDFTVNVELDRSNYYVRKIWPIESAKIVYTTDVSIYEHSRFVAFKRPGKDIEAFEISRDYQDENGNYFVLITFVDLHKKVSDTWFKQSDLDSINSFCGTDYKLNKRMSIYKSALFMADACAYFGSNEFGTAFRLYVNDEQTSDEFYTWLVSCGLVKSQF